MSNQKMGYEGQIYFGSTPGTTASTLLTNVRDITITYDKEAGDTTVRGDGLSVPLKTEQVTAIDFTLEWQMIYDITDTSFIALHAAAATGEGVAIRTRDYATGQGFDGDMTLSASKPMPMAGEQVVTFTGKPSRAYGRAPAGYV